MLDFLDTKKKLPGERKPVFPEGVPGLEQGVPKDCTRAPSRSRWTSRTPRQRLPPRRPPQEPKSKRGAKGKQPAAAGRAPDAASSLPSPDADAAPEEEGSTAAAPPPPKAEDRAPAHHRTAARCACAARAAAGATIRCTVPGADAERHLYALIWFFISLTRACLTAQGSSCPSRLQSSAGPMSASRRCSTGWSGKSSRWSTTAGRHPRPPRREARSATSNSPSSTPPASTRAPRAR